MGRRIHDRNNIHITSDRITIIICSFPICINSTDIYCKWFFCQTVIFGRTAEIKFCFNLMLINNANLITITFHCIFHQFCIRLIINDRINFARSKSFCLFLNRCIFCRSDISYLILNIKNSSLHIFRSGVKLYSKIIV